jgi:tRNA A37 N6-isopentenylltransferase MiaA
MVEELAAKTRQFAKRQRLWLKNDPSIVWLPFPANTVTAAGVVKEFVNSQH